MTEALDVAARTQIDRVVPGLSVVVADAEGALLDTGFGLADRATEVPMTSGSICNWFSMTKVVTATAAVQLADRGLLDLDSPVVEHYEPFAAMRPAERARKVTVRHLLSHSAGVANPLPLGWVHLATEPGPPPDELVERLLTKHRRLRFEPGAKASYTNVGYLVLGQVIAQVTGQPYTDYVRTNLLQPLGMARTDFVATDPAVWATPYQKRRTAISALMPLLIPRAIIGPRDDRFVSLRHFYLDGAAYGGLVGPATDAVRFVRAHLRGGELDGERILSEERCREMQQIISHGRRIEVGLGWFRRGTRPDGDFVEHLGGGAGFWTCMRIYPARGIGVVVMGNATSYDHDTIVRSAVH
jgi:CubicO group peptidase (beta-lactamase class C family)